MKIKLKDIEIELSEEQLKEITDKYAVKDDVRFKPKDGKSYYYITDNGTTKRVIFDNDNLDDVIYNQGNMFRTKEDAEWALKQYDTRLNNLIIQWRLKYDRVDIDWESEVSKYYIYFYLNSKKYRIGSSMDIKQNIPYFSSYNKAEECIKWLEGVL